MRSVWRLPRRREGSTRGDGGESGGAGPNRRDGQNVHRRRLGANGTLRETRGRGRTLPEAVRHRTRAGSWTRTCRTGPRGAGSARLAPESEAAPTVRDARQAVLDAELPRDRPDVRPDIHVPDLLRPHGGRRRLRARLDDLRRLAASAVERPGVGLLEEPPRHTHLGWILVPPLWRLLLRGGVRDPVPPCSAREHSGRAARLVRDPRGQPPAPRAAGEARANHGLHRPIHPR